MPTQDFTPGDIVTDAATKTLRGTVVEPEPPITAHNIGNGNVLVQWTHLSSSQPEPADLLEKVATEPHSDLPDGELNIHIGHDESGAVIVNFGIPVTWLSIPAADAANLALTILFHANARVSVNVNDDMVNRIIEYQKNLAPGSSAYLSRAQWRAAIHFAVNGNDEAP